MEVNDTLSLFLRDFVAGGFSGIIAKTIVAPIERVKILLQTQKVNSRIDKKNYYHGPRDCLRDIIEKEGVLSLWRGNVATVIRYFPNQAFNFAMKDKFRRLLGISASSKEKGGAALVFASNILAGSAAGATTSLLTYPLDMARTRLATDVVLSQGRQFRGVWHCVQQSYESGGFARVYRGFTVSVFGAALFRGLFFGGYDNVKLHLNLENASMLKRYLAAQAITTVVGTLCYPIDTIKRRMMIQTNFEDMNGDCRSKSNTYMNGRQCIRYILRNEGVRGLYAGLSVNILRGVSGALLLVCYDEAKKIVHGNS